MKLQWQGWLLSALLLATSLSKGSMAQTTTSGGLSGVVTDQSGAALPGIDVGIKDNLRGTIQSTKTDREGVYRFFFLLPSTYAVTVTQNGFRTESRTVNVLLGPSGTFNVTLEIAAARTEVTVIAEAPLIQAENGDASTTVSQQQISEVPNPGNDLTYIVQTAPGVVMNTDSQGTGGIQSGAPNFSILGMPGTSYHVTVDGMSITENGNNFVATGSLGLVLGQNQIQETTVVNNGYSGQFGDAAGGNVNYVTKAGSDEFHGNAQYYWNGRVLNANDWFANATGSPRFFSIANQWAGSFGGPIRKDKLFFFLDTEGLRLLIAQIFPSVVIPTADFESAAIANIDSKLGSASPSDAFYKQIFSVYNSAPGAISAGLGGFNPTADPTGCTGFSDPATGLGVSEYCARHFYEARSVPSQDALVSGRLDWNLNSDRTFFRIQETQGRGTFYTDPISAVFDANYNVSTWQGQVVETHSFGSSAANQLLIALSGLSYIWAPAHLNQALSALPTYLNFSVPNTFTNVGFYWNSEFGCRCRQFQLSDDFLKMRGKHKLGFGLALMHIHWNIPPNKGNSLGTLYPQTLRAFYEGGEGSSSPSPDSTQLTQSFTSQSTTPLSFTNFAAYGQEEWHVSSGLALTFAIRAEHYSNPLCESHCFSRPGVPFESLNHDPLQPYSEAVLTNLDHALLGLDAVLWSPRFSFAWQPFGVSHHNVLRGGIGFFYDPLRVGFAEAFYLNTPNFNLFNAFAGNLAPTENNSLFQTTSASNQAFVDGFSSGNTLAEFKQTVPDFVPPGLTASERKVRLPQYQRWSLEWQQTLGIHTTVSVAYFGHHGIHEMYTNPSANAFGFGSLPDGPCIHPVVLPCSDPRFGQVSETFFDAVSNYNGVVSSFQHQFTRLGNGLVQVNYTFSHAFDEGSGGFTSGSSNNPQDSRNLRDAYGPAEYDVRHSLNADYAWELPAKKAFGGHGPDMLIKGWQISGTVFARTGSPYTVFDRAKSGELQQNNYFGQIYAVPTGPLLPRSRCGEAAAFTNPVHPCLPSQFLVRSNGSTQPNPGALFLQETCESEFNSGHLPGPLGPCSGSVVSFAQRRNHFRGPGFFNSDLGIMKNTNLHGWEHAALGIGVQFFNLLNHPNFGFPDNSTDAAFGQIFYLQQPPTSILGSGLGGDAAPRMIQLKAQLQF